MAYEKDCDVVTTLGGTEYIRALDKDGFPVRIPVAELAKSIIKSTDLLSLALLFRGSISYTNYDTTTTPGVYNVLGTSSGSKPYEDWGVLIVLQPFSTQIYIKANDATILFRNRLDSGWTPWKKVISSII